MSAEMAMCSVVDSRESERLTLDGTADCDYGLGERGRAQRCQVHWRDVSRGGACIALGRYVRPGRRISLVSHDRVVHDEPTVIDARVVWCRPDSDGMNFLAGVRFQRNDAESCFAVSSLVREAHKARLCHLAEQLRLGR